MNYDHLSDVYEDYLEHYGILGMKWGVRRTPEQLGHARPTREERKETRTLKRNAAAAIKNLKEKGETHAKAEWDVVNAQEDYRKVSKKMYLFKRNRMQAIKEAGERLTTALENAERPRAERNLAADIYEDAAKKLLDNNRKMIEKYGSDTIKEVGKKTIEWGITNRKTGLFTDTYEAFAAEVVKTGPTIVNIPWYGQRYTGRMVAEREIKEREKRLNKKANELY